MPRGDRCRSGPSRVPGLRAPLRRAHRSDRRMSLLLRRRRHLLTSAAWPLTVAPTESPTKHAPPSPTKHCRTAHLPRRTLPTTRLHDAPSVWRTPTTQPPDTQPVTHRPWRTPRGIPVARRRGTLPSARPRPTAHSHGALRTECSRTPHSLRATPCAAPARSRRGRPLFHVKQSAGRGESPSS